MADPIELGARFFVAQDDINPSIGQLIQTLIGANNTLGDFTAKLGQTAGVSQQASVAVSATATGISAAGQAVAQAGQQVAEFGVRFNEAANRWQSAAGTFISASEASTRMAAAVGQAGQAVSQSGQQAQQSAASYNAATQSWQNASGQAITAAQAFQLQTQALNQANAAAQSWAQQAAALGAGGQAAAGGVQAVAGAAQGAAGGLGAVAGATQGAAGGINAVAGAAGAAGLNINNLTINLRQAAQAGQQAQTMYVSIGAVLQGLPGPLGQAMAGFGMLHGQIDLANAGTLAMATTFGILGQALAGALGETVDQARQFERTFADVQVVSQASAESMAAMQAAAMQIGVTTQYNSQQAAQGLYELTSAGFTAREAIEALVPVTTAAMLGNRNLGDTTKDVVAGLRQFGMGADETTHLVDVMTLAVQGSVVHWNEVGGLFDNLRGRMGQLKIPLEDVVAAEMLMTNSGMSAAQASTAIGTAVDRLSKQTRETATGLKELGLNVFDARGNFVGLLNIYEQLEAKLPTMTTQQSAHAIAMLGGSRAAGAFQNILHQTQSVMIDGNEVTKTGADLFDYWAQRLRAADGASASAAETIGRTLDFRLRNLAGSVGEAQIRLGNELLPTISALVPVATGLVNAFVQAPEPIHAMAAATMASAAAMGIATAAVVAWGVANTAFSTSIIAAQGALLTMLPPIALVVAASAGLALAWSNDWGNIREHTEDTKNQVVQWLSDLRDDADLTTKYLDRVAVPRAQGSGVGQFFNAVGTNVQESGAAAAIATATGNNTAWNDAGQTAGRMFAENFWITVLPATPMGILQMVQKIKEQLEGAKPGIQKDIFDSMNPSEQQQYLDNEAQGTVDSMVASIITQVNNGRDLTGAAMDALYAQMKGEGKSRDEIVASWDERYQVVLERIRQYKPAMVKAGQDQSDALAAGMTSHIQTVQEAADQLLEASKGNYKKAAADAAEAGNQLAATYLYQQDAIHHLVESAITPLDAASKGLVQTMMSQKGPQETLNFLLEKGAVTGEEYRKAIQGITTAHAAQSGAAESAAKAEKNLRAEMTPGQQVMEGQAQSVVNQITQGTTIDVRARLADYGKGKSFQQQLQDMMGATGLGSQFGIGDLYYGTPQGIQDRAALIAAALQGGAATKLVPAAKEAGKSLADGMATGITGEQTNIEGAATKVGTAGAEAFTTSFSQGLSSEQARGLLQQYLDDMAAGLDPEEAKRRYQAALQTILTPDPGTAEEPANDFAASYIGQLSQALNDDAPTAIEGFKDAIRQRLGSDPEAEAKAQAGGQLIEDAFAQGLTAGGAARVAAKYFDGLPVAIDAGAPPAVTAAEVAGQAIHQAFAGQLTPEKAGDLASAFGTALSAQLGDKAEPIKAGVQVSLEAALSPVAFPAIVAGSAVALGASIIGGIAQGVTDGIPTAVAAIKSGAMQLVEAAKSVIRPGSPSRTMADEVGRPMAEGIGAGFMEGLGGVQGLLTAGLGSLVTGASATMQTNVGTLVADINAEIVQQTDKGIRFYGEEPAIPFRGTVENTRGYGGSKQPILPIPVIDDPNWGPGATEPGATPFNPYEDPNQIFPQDTTIAGIGGGRGRLASVVGGSRTAAQLLGGMDTGGQGADVLATKIADAVAEAIPAAVQRSFVLDTGPYARPYTGQGVSLPGAGVPPVAYGGPVAPPPSQDEIRQLIETVGRVVPVYGISAADQARQQEVQRWMYGGGAGPVRGTTALPNVSGYGLDPFMPLPTALAGYRSMTTAEAARQLANRPATSPIGGMGTGAGEITNYAALPAPGTPATPGYVWNYDGRRIPQAEWDQQQQGRQPGMGAINVPGVPAGMTYAQAVAANPYNQVGPADAQAAEDFQNSLRGSTRELQQQAAVQQLLTQADQGVVDQYVSHRATLQAASHSTEDFNTRVAQTDQGIADLGGTFNHFMATTDQVRMTEEEWRASLGGAVGETEGTFAHLNGSAQTAHQRLSDLGDIAQQNTSSFTQIGDLSVGLGTALDTGTRAADDFRRHSELVTAGLGSTGSALTSFQGVVHNADGTIDRLATNGTRLMAAQGAYIDQIGHFQSTLTDVTTGLGTLADDTGALGASFQSAGDIFAGEGGPGLSSGFEDKFFNLLSGLLPGNVNPSDFWAPGGNIARPKPLPTVANPATATQLAGLLTQLVATGTNPIPTSLANVAWLQGPGAGINPATGRFEGNGNQAMSPDLMFQLGLGGDQGQLALQASSTQRLLSERFGIAPGTVSSQSFNDLVSQKVSDLVGNGRPVNAAGVSPEGFLDAAKAAQGGAGAGGGTSTGGSGFASVGLVYPTINGQTQSDLVRDTSPQAMGQLNTQYNAMMQQEAKDLANNVTLASLAWSSIADFSKQADNSVAHIAGAFSSYGIDLNAKMASSISGSWTVPTMGGPSGPMPPGPGSGPGVVQGNTYGGQSYQALLDLEQRVQAQTGAQPGSTTYNRALAEAQRTDQQYIQVVGQTTDTMSDYQRQMDEAKQDVSNLTNVVNQLGSSYAEGIGVMDQLNAAQARVSSLAGQMAGSVGAGGGPAPVNPLAQGQPMPPTPAGGGTWVVGPYGQGWQLLKPEYTFTQPTGTTSGAIGGVPQTTGVPTPVTATTGTPTPTTTVTPTINPNAAVLVAHTPTEDIYRMPNGSLKHVPAGSAIPSLAAGAIVTQPTLAFIGEGGRPEGVYPLEPGAQAPGGNTTIGDVHVHITLPAGSQVTDPIEIAKVGKLIREELRRSGAYMSKTKD